MAEASIYLTPVGTPQLSPAQQPRKRNQSQSVFSESFLGTQVENASKQMKKVPPSRAPKTKQTKSRNGCHTCKAKRLKCDETKPGCQNCARRNVQCEGYKREFKWKGFPEQNIGRKLTQDPSSNATRPPPRYRRNRSSGTTADRECSVDTNRAECIDDLDSPVQGEQEQTPDSELSETLPSNDTTATFAAVLDDFLQYQSNANNIQASDASNDMLESALCLDSTWLDEQLLDPLLLGNAQNSPGSNEAVNASNCPQAESFGRDPNPSSSTMQTSSNLNSEGEISMPSSESSLIYNDEVLSSMTINVPSQIQFQPTSLEQLTMRFFNSTCSIMSIFPITTPHLNPWHALIWPLVQSGCFPVLHHALLAMSCFHGLKVDFSLRRQGAEHMRTSVSLLQANQAWLGLPIEVTLATCIALAFSESWMCWNTNVKSGAGYIQNAKQCVMAALSNGAVSKEQKKRLRFLCKTYLYVDVIARLTSYDADASDEPFDGIAERVLGMPLVSEHDSTNERNPRIPATNSTATGSSCSSKENRLDPLMGSASTLFPIIGRVANLVRKAYNTTHITPSIISCAVELKQMLEQWTCPTAIDHALIGQLRDDAHATAESYRLSTLLHLHQTLPQLLPCDTTLRSYSSKLGLKILNLLARVPPSSGTVIVQIYPLLVGGCEATSDEDREWVRRRWRGMENRMGIGNVSKAREIAETVWQKRDHVEGNSQSRIQFDIGLEAMLSARSSSWDETCSHVGGIGLGLEEKRHYSWPVDGEELDFDEIFDFGGDCYGSGKQAAGRGEETKTGKEEVEDVDFAIHGRLHWVSAMKEKGWEVLLG